jgi:hypothetical protein
MDRDDYTDATYTQPHVPPATPPVIDADADANDAATLAMANGDSDYSGSRAYRFPRGEEDEELQHGGEPDEVEPDEGGDTINPQSPDEVVPDDGDTVEPGATPDEAEPGSTPVETPMPPD